MAPKPCDISHSTQNTSIHLFLPSYQLAQAEEVRGATEAAGAEATQAAKAATTAKAAEAATAEIAGATAATCALAAEAEGLITQANCATKGEAVSQKKTAKTAKTGALIQCEDALKNVFFSRNPRMVFLERGYVLLLLSVEVTDSYYHVVGATKDARSGLACTLTPRLSASCG